MNLGADDYLTKPVANADLIRAIEARLRRSERQAHREVVEGHNATALRMPQLEELVARG